MPDLRPHKRLLLCQVLECNATDLTNAVRPASPAHESALPSAVRARFRCQAVRLFAPLASEKSSRWSLAVQTTAQVESNGCAKQPASVSKPAVIAE